MRKGLMVLAAVAALGCGREGAGTTLAETRFIEVMVELRRAALRAPDPGVYEAEKQQILRNAGVTEAELRAYVERHGRDLEHMAAVWESINVRLSQPEDEDGS
jgi:hypothetical protein